MDLATDLRERRFGTVAVSAVEGPERLSRPLFFSSRAGLVTERVCGRAIFTLAALRGWSSLMTVVFAFELWPKAALTCFLGPELTPVKGLTFSFSLLASGWAVNLLFVVVLLVLRVVLRVVVFVVVVEVAVVVLDDFVIVERVERVVVESVKMVNAMCRCESACLV